MLSSTEEILTKTAPEEEINPRLHNIDPIRRETRYIDRNNHILTDQSEDGISPSQSEVPLDQIPDEYRAISSIPVLLRQTQLQQKYDIDFFFVFEDLEKSGENKIENSAYSAWRVHVTIRQKKP